MSKPKFTSTRGNGNNSAGVNQGHTFTHDDPPAPFGWQGDKKPRRATQAPPRASARSLGNMEPGRLADFEQGVKESRDQRAKTAAIMLGTFVGVRALQHWSAWKREQGR